MTDWVDFVFFSFAEENDEFSSTALPTKGEAEKIGEKAAEITEALAHEMGIPTWGLVSIIIAVLVVILGICGFCIRRCFRKRRSKDKKGGKGVDMKSVQLLGSAYKEKVFSRISFIKCVSVQVHCNMCVH